MTVPLKLIGNRGASALVQWSAKGREHRALLPQSAVADGAASAADLSAGVPMSADWMGMWNAVADRLAPKAVEAELQRNNIWTVEDAMRDPARFYGALQRLAGLAGADMIRNVRGG